MAEPGSNAAPSATDKNTFHGLIMNTLCKIEELPRDPFLLCRSGTPFVNRPASKPDGSARGVAPSGRTSAGGRAPVQHPAAVETRRPPPSCARYGVVVESVKVSAFEYVPVRSGSVAFTSCVKVIVTGSFVT